MASASGERACGPGTSTSVAERDAMRRAIELAQSPGVPLGPNPRVGCVLLSPEGETVGEGHHRGAGTPHAEVVALERAGDRAAGATAVVSLEPCNHTGRTGPCTRALLAAGVVRVVFAQSDANPTASGGADALAAAGVEVTGGLLARQAREVNQAWSFAIEHERPFVTWKLAATLDGRSAAVDGTSRWITSPPARSDVHRLRALCDVVLVGTGTAVTDDPALTVRDDEGHLAAYQPMRAVMGIRELAEDLRLFDDAAQTVVLPTRDPAEGLALLYRLDRQHVFLEGGPTLGAAFLRAGLVDEVIAYLAPALLGAGTPVVADLGITTMADILRFTVRDVSTVGEGRDTCVRVTLAPGTVETRQEA